MNYPLEYDAMNHTTLTPKVGVGVVIVNDGKMLLMQRSLNVSHGKGQWSVIGGHIELGETVTDAAVRETKEEIGVDIQIVSYLGWAECMLPEYHSISVFVQAVIESGEPQILEPEILEPEKAIDLRFVEYDEIANMALFDPFRRYYNSGKLRL